MNRISPEFQRVVLLWVQPLTTRARKNQMSTIAKVRSGWLTLAKKNTSLKVQKSYFV